MMVINFFHGTRPINRRIKLIKKRIAAVEKLSLTINPQIIIIGRKSGRIPSFHLSNRSFFLTNNLER